MTQELTIFQYHGESYIGYLMNIGSGEASKPSFPEIGTNYEDRYVFRAPMKINYSIRNPESASAKLESMLIPTLSIRHFTGLPTSIYFAYPKNEVVLCTATDSDISTELTQAYKVMSGQ